jgi:hypothetical protein
MDDKDYGVFVVDSVGSVGEFARPEDGTAGGAVGGS